MCSSLEEVRAVIKKILINKAVHQKKIRFFQFQTGLPRMLYPLPGPKFIFIFGPSSLHEGSI